VIRAAVAQGWGAGVAKVCKQPFPDCTRCRRPESLTMRKTWGCDAPALRPVWESTCPRCSGTDSECARCEGEGVASYNRCPNAVVRESSKSEMLHLDLLMRAYSHYDRRNVLPSGGAWLDQTRSFLACVDLIDAERNHWEGIRAEHEHREAERASRSQSRGGGR